LRVGGHVTPDQCGADDTSLLVEHDRAVHLAGEADAGDVVGTQVGFSQCLGNRDATGPPPVFGTLFGPSDSRGGKRFVLFRGRRDHVALVVDDECARAAGAYVDA